MIKLLKNNVKCQGHDLSNNVCEYEVNRLTNENVIRGKRNFNGNRGRLHWFHQSISRYFL